MEVVLMLVLIWRGELPQALNYWVSCALLIFKGPTKGSDHATRAGIVLTVALLLCNGSNHAELVSVPCLAKLRHQVEVSGELHAPTALTPGHAG
jgi:hypothetical protein